MENLHDKQPWSDRVVLLSYTLVDEVHSLVDEAEHAPRRLDQRIKRVSCCGLIFFGVLISTLGKLAYEVQAEGRDGITRPFHKPQFLVLLMFVGMSFNLPLSLFLDLVRCHRRMKRIPSQPMYVPLMQYDNLDEEVHSPLHLLDPMTAHSSSFATRLLVHKQLLLLFVPTVFDMLGSAMLNVGLLSVTASATAMLRQSLLVFAAVLAVGLWGKRLNRYHAAGLLGCLAGLGMVAGASLASGFGGSTAPQNRGTMAAGIGLVLASQFVAAGQLLYDRLISNGRMQLSPLKVVGCEGLLGAMLMVLVVLPIAGVGHAGWEGWGLAEDTLDSVVMIAGTPMLQLLLLAYTGSLQAYNLCGMVTAGEFTAVDTTLLQAVRTLFVWIINLLIYAVASALVPDAAASAQQADLLVQAAGHSGEGLGSTSPQPDHISSATVALAAAASQEAAGDAGGRPAAPMTSARLLRAMLWQWHQGHGLARGALPQDIDVQPATGGAALTLVPCHLVPASNSSTAGVLHALTRKSNAWWQLLMQGQHYHNNLLPDDGFVGQTHALPVQAAPAALPGEPWMSWSFLQAAGFVVLVIAAVTYSKGDSEGLRKQLQDEADLIMMDQPPSVAGSFSWHSGRQAHRFTAHMDIDSAAYLGSFRRGRDRDGVEYGITPISASFNFANDSSLSGRQRLLAGHEPSLASSRESVGGMESYEEGEEIEVSHAERAASAGAGPDS